MIEKIINPQETITIADHPRRSLLEQAAQERILLFDGAMGTMIQQLHLIEEDWHCPAIITHLKEPPSPLQGNNDLLVLAQPEAIRDIHTAYLKAGTDIICTNSFNATAISQADYGTQALVGTVNFEAARLARETADAWSTEQKPRFVAGALGPTNQTASLSPRVTDPGYRAVTFEDLSLSYEEAAHALIRGGCDLLILETIFDTLNAKAALYAIDRLFAKIGLCLPLIISGTITDRAGRTLSGQTAEAFWYSIRHACPFAVGFNCALGAAELRPHIASLATAADVRISAYPNAGLPNEMGGYDETPEMTATHIAAWADDGLVNLVGGCCGTTPAHIAAIGDAIAGIKPRLVPSHPPALRLSGLEPFILPASNGAQTDILDEDTSLLENKKPIFTPEVRL